MPPHAPDPDRPCAIYRTTDPSGAARLQVLLEDGGVPALLQTRNWANLTAWPLNAGRPTLYEVLVSSAALESHRAELEAALAQVREELGPESEV